MRISILLVALVATAQTLGCTSQQLYGTGQAWQRNQCNKIVDMQERNRCMESTNTSYEDYQRETERNQGAKRP